MSSESYRKPTTWEKQIQNSKRKEKRSFCPVSVPNSWFSKIHQYVRDKEEECHPASTTREIKSTFSAAHAGSSQADHPHADAILNFEPMAFSSSKTQRSIAASQSHRSKPMYRSLLYINPESLCLGQWTRCSAPIILQSDLEKQAHRRTQMYRDYKTSHLKTFPLPDLHLLLPTCVMLTPVRSDAKHRNYFTVNVSEDVAKLFGHISNMVSEHTPPGYTFQSPLSQTPDENNLNTQWTLRLKLQTVNKVPVADFQCFSYNKFKYVNNVSPATPVCLGVRLTRAYISHPLKQIGFMPVVTQFHSLDGKECPSCCSALKTNEDQKEFISSTCNYSLNAQVKENSHAPVDNIHSARLEETRLWEQKVQKRRETLPVRSILAFLTASCFRFPQL